MVDNLDEALDRFRRQPHRKAVLFVDNAGADVLLGMLPFARQLLKAGTKVTAAQHRHRRTAHLCIAFCCAFIKVQEWQ